MMRQWWAVRILTGLMLVTVASTCAMAGQVTLRWNANRESDLGGYIVYFGTSSGAYTEEVDVGLTTSPEAPEVTLDELITGSTYFFVVTAYDISGNESDLSSEVSKTVGEPSEPCIGTRSSRLWGRVTTLSDSTKILGVTLNLTGPWGCTEVTITRFWGLFWLPRLGNGTYTIVPTKAGCTFDPSQETVTLIDETVRIDFRGSCS